MCIRGLASLVNTFVTNLTGDQLRELHVSNMASLGFDPDGLLIQVIQTSAAWTNLRLSLQFLPQHLSLHTASNYLM